MSMGVDQARKHDFAGAVEHLLCPICLSDLFVGSDGKNPAVIDRDGAIADQ